MAFASIFVPQFMLQAVARAEPALAGRALAVVEGNPPLCRVADLNEKAAQAGIRPGMNKTDAERAPGLEIRPRSRALEKAAHAALLDAGWSVSPQIEDTAEDTILLNLAGLAHLFGSEEQIGAHLAERARACGLQPNIAISANVETARIAARGYSGVTVIPAGQEANCLGPLPVSVLAPSAETVETLCRWGIHTCAALGALPVLELSERLGQEGVRLHALARGAESRALVIAEPGYSFEEEMELEDAVAELEPLSFLLGRLLDQLCARLVARSLAAAALHVRFKLEPSSENAFDIQREMFRRNQPPGQYEREMALPVPARDPKMLLKLLWLRLQANPPAGPVRKILLAAEAARPRATQGGLFVPRFPEPEKLEITLARIANIVGEGNVGSPSPADTHRPEAFHMERFLVPLEGGEKIRDASGARQANKPRRGSQPAASFRALRPPVPAKVELRAGRPARVMFQGRRGDVLAASGPWRGSGDWWGDAPWQEDEWDLEIQFRSSAERGIYRISYDAMRQGWLVRGIYD